MLIGHTTLTTRMVSMKQCREGNPACWQSLYQEADIAGWLTYSHVTLHRCLQDNDPSCRGLNSADSLAVMLPSIEGCDKL